jgi:hypothetical protein
VAPRILRNQKRKLRLQHMASESLLISGWSDCIQTSGEASQRITPRPPLKVARKVRRVRDPVHVQVDWSDLHSYLRYGLELLSCTRICTRIRDERAETAESAEIADCKMPNTS